MITQNYLTISPAYGRDYKSAKDATSAFLEGKDFKMESLMGGGTYCSIRDFSNGVTVSIRYSRMTKVVNVKAVKSQSEKTIPAGSPLIKVDSPVLTQ